MSETQLESVHGHEVMHFMLTRSEGFTKESLVEAIKEKFGAQTRFHTCSKSEMTADDLVEFLESKGKFSSRAPNGFNTDPQKICSHH